MDPLEYPVVGRMAARLRVHDDRQEFLAGIDIVLDGVLGRPQTG